MVGRGSLQNTPGCETANRYYDDQPGKVYDQVNANYILKEIARCTWECGDPGLFMGDEVEEWNTVPSHGAIVSCNPCQPGWATVLTPYGIRSFDETDVGNTIWSGKKWTTITRKQHTGTKPVFAFKTRAGIFYGTEKHQVAQRGEKVRVSDAETIDTTQGPTQGLVPQVDPQDIMDGLVLGDGTVHGASKNLPPLLCIGEKDQDYFQSEVGCLIGKSREKTAQYGWEVSTSLGRDEVPRTYERCVPSRFRFGSSTKVRGFLRGLYSANGSIVDQRITLKASSFSVVEAVQEMLSSIGIRSYHTVNAAHEVEFSNGTYICKESYDINITTDRTEFHDLINFIQKDKQNRLAVICGNFPGSKEPKKSYEIISRTYVATEPVYDITVEADEHTYWTGGLLVSNCFEFIAPVDSACNLASINLVKFLNDDGSFDLGNLQASGANTHYSNGYYCRRGGLSNREDYREQQETAPIGARVF